MTNSPLILSRNPRPAPSTGGVFARIRIGDLNAENDSERGDVFTFGDGLLTEVEVTLSVGAGSTNCRFTIYDPKMLFAQKYFETTYSLEGLDPVLQPTQATRNGQTTAVNASAASVGGFDSNAIQQAINFYAGQGFSPYAIAAMVGNALQESSLNPQAVGTDQGTGYAASEGIFQWTFDRKDGMPADLAGQLQFSITEMDRDSPGVRAVLTNPNSSQAQIQSAIQSWIRWGDTGSRWDYAQTILGQVGSGAPAAATSVQSTTNNTVTTTPQTPVVARAGQQITVELGHKGRGFVAYSFLHTGLRYSLTAPNFTTFSGDSVQWIMNRRKTNTAYVNVTFKEIAQKVADKYGLVLNMPNAGPTYEYFPQRGVTDWEMLVIECRRLGYLIKTTAGRELLIAPRDLTIRTSTRIPQSYEEEEEDSSAEETEEQPLTTNQTEDGAYILRYGFNLRSFDVEHSAGSDSSGARSSDPNERSVTGQKGTYVDPGTGELIQETEEEDPATSSAESEEGGTTEETTGGHIQLVAPLQTAPVDPNAAENERRVRGIKATFTADCLPETLDLNPDVAIVTQGLAAPFLNRAWVVESVTHRISMDSYPETSGVLYTPMRNKRPVQNNSSTYQPGLPLPAGCAGLVASAAAAYRGSNTSAGPGAGNLACVWAVNRVFENAGLTPPWGSSEFVPTTESSLISSGAAVVPLGQERPGDIVIWSGSHIGIILDRGKAISNSSSAARFQWETDATANGYFSSTTIYRLNC